jgi:uncharacterized membrane protein
MLGLVNPPIFFVLNLEMIRVMWFGMGFMWLWPIGLVIIGAIIYYAVISSDRASCSLHPQNQQQQYYGPRSFEILKQRYAKGEITREQFLQMKEELR